MDFQSVKIYNYIEKTWELCSKINIIQIIAQSLII